ncbi:Tfg1 protein [Candida orthopsilosis Co 90-125]|uniref:Transcription initiation factor IIF subunit alpha n=1 Tax=Candida orthopsilosis (strain 90-125) TaxID=1136231 RepID=H8X6Q2_CANO9|nr:Tfg1 protein [Candida orthopsilosis Co 90-125]CCG23663.1 Tfg1 protein [Candida orthopsilosis Co 90-125]
MSQQEPQVKKEVTVKNESTGNSLAKNGSPSPSKSEEWQTIPLKSCGPEEIEDVRVHLMKFATKQDVDIVKDFEKPVRLHRKDPRNMQFHLTRQELDQRRKEKEEAEKERLQREAEEGAEGGEKSSSAQGTHPDSQNDPNYNKNSADMSQVAPDGGARKNKKKLFKRKTKQINLMDEAKRKLRYEEHYPWVIEDYTGKNVYVGNYEAGSTESQHVLFVFDKDGFKMIPAEKVYRFTPRNRYATLTLEEAEAKMEKNSSVPRWLMKHMENDSIAEGSPDQRFRNNSPSANGRVISNGGTQNRRMRTVMGGDSRSVEERDSDHDDLDFEEEFADDEEAPIMDGDEEENKMSEKKIKKDMLKASAFKTENDDDDDEDYDLDDLFETEKSRKVDKEGKKLRKVLNKREGGIYDSDDEEQGMMPYLSKSDLESEEDSDDETRVNVKEEPTENALTGETQKLGIRNFVVSSIADGFVVMKAPKEFLSTLPLGEWNPNVPKRSTPEPSSPRKKMRLDENQSVVTIKKEPSPVATSVPGSPVDTNAMADLNDAGPNNLLVTIDDVLTIVRDHPLTTRELLGGLKSRISAHPDNKQRIIAIVKSNLRLVDGKLVLKN